MAITGTFLANFAPFYDAVVKAEAHLTDLSAGADKVGTRLNAMQDSFSGKKIIQDATLMAEAVSRVGGVSQLTEKELARVSATAAEAAAKMKAMGVDVPPGIQKIADEAKGADKAHDALASTVRRLAADFVALFTVRAAFNFVKDILADASALQDLSQQTHINVEDLQVLAGGMSEFGVDADTLGRGLFKLSQGIAGGDESVAHGLHLMGLSLKDVDGLKGKDLFLKIEEGLATLQGGLRDTAAADLFGAKLGAAMAGASEGIKGAMDKWKDFNTVANPESVAALDAFGEAIARAKKNVDSLATNVAGPLAKGFNDFVDVSNKTGPFEAFWARIKDAIAGTHERFEQLAKDAQVDIGPGAGGPKRVADINLATKATKELTDAEKFMAALEADAAVVLSAAQLRGLAHLKEMGVLTAANADGIGVKAAAYAKYLALQAEGDKAEALRVKAEADANAASMTYLANRIKGMAAVTAANQGNYGYKEQIAQLKLLDAAEQERSRVAIAEMEAQHASVKELARVKEEAELRHIELLNQELAIEKKQMELVNAAVLDQLAATTKTNAEAHRDAAGAYEVTVLAVDKYNRALHDLELTEQLGISQAPQRQAILDQYYKDLKKESGVIDEVTDATKAFGAATTTEFGKATVATLAWAAAIDKAARAMGVFVIGNRPGESAASPYQTGAPLSFGSSPSEGTSSYMPPIDTQFRAEGGPVSRGSSYVVGERGPELYTPSANGVITPNGGGGGSTQVFNFNGLLVTTDPRARADFASAVIAAISPIVRSQRKLPA
jgi:hypothetical protein